MRISHNTPDDDEDRGLQNVGFKLSLDVANYTTRILCSLKLSAAQRTLNFISG